MVSVGERIGPYALRERLQGGAETELWRAERDDGRQRGPSVVAMRLARRAEAASALRRREYAALRAVEDKRFPRVVAYFAGQGALATTWVEGADLREIIDAAAEGLIPLEPATAVDIALEVAQGVRAAHLAPDGPWVHGHIDPSQIFLTEDGAVVVLGLGHQPESPDRDYLPPEQLAHRNADARSDQWAIGALLYEMTTFTSLAASQEQRQGQSLGALAVQQPAVARVLRTALAKEASLRYGSDGDFVRALHSLARELGGTSGRARLVQRLRNPEPEVQLPPAPRGVEDAPSVPPRGSPSLDRRPASVDRRPASVDRPVRSVDHRPASVDRPARSLDRRPASVDRPASSLDRRPASVDRPATSLDRRPASLDRPATSLDRRPASVDRPARSLDRPSRSLDRAPFSVDRPSISVDRPARPVDRAPFSLERAPPSLDASSPSLDRPQVSLDRAQSSVDRPQISVGRPSQDRPAAPVSVERVPVGLGPPQRDPRSPARPEAITEDFEVFGAEPAEDDPTVGRSALGPPAVSLARPRSVSVGLPPRARSSVDLPVDPPGGLRQANPTLSPEEPQAQGSTLRITTLSAHSLDEAVDDEDTDDKVPGARPVVVSASFDDDDLPFGDAPGPSSLGFDDAPVLETPSQNALAPPVEEAWLDEDKRPTVGDEPAGPPMMDLPPSMHADPLPDDIPTAGDPEPLAATFNPAEQVALVALALFTMTAVYVALRNFT